MKVSQERLSGGILGNISNDVGTTKRDATLRYYLALQDVVVGKTMNSSIIKNRK